MLSLNRDFKILIVMSKGRLHVRLQEKEAEAKGEAGQDSPADETQHQPEELHLVTLHHLSTLLHGIGGTDLLVVFQNVFCLGEHHQENDARKDQQYEADSDTYTNEESC